MSTRGCYRFSDGSNYGPFTVYKHSDNYPWTKHGGVAAIAKALSYAWPLPRYEADEFAAAFVAANKHSALDMARTYEEEANAEPDNTDRKKYLLENAAKYRDPKSSYAQMVGGGVRLLNTPDAMTLEHMPQDIEYLYDVSCRKGVLHVKVYDISGGWDNKPLKASLMAEGTLNQMLEHFKEEPVEA